MEPARPVRPHLSDHPNGLAKEVETPEPASPRTNQAEEELGRFFFRSLDLLCIAGFDGYFKRLDSAWETRSGWPVAELVARPFLDFVHPDDRQATLAELGELAGGAETILFENRYRPSSRPYPRRVPEVEYPGHYEVRRVHRGGEIKWQGQALFVSEALAGEPVGLEETDDGIGSLHFASLLLARFDERERQLQVFRMIGQGQSTREIAQSLGLGNPRTHQSPGRTYPKEIEP